VIAGCIVCASLAVFALGQPRGAQAVHDKTYWRHIVDAKFEPPAGATAAGLTGELLDQLGAPDPELRDDLTFSILTAWIYQKKLLGADELRAAIARLEANLRVGIGETGTDRILLRSFSALTLSVIAARENETPFLSRDEYQRLLDAAIAYLHDERDTRGFDPQKGWMHSVAHTADLLRFLARHRALRLEDQSRILAALTDKSRVSPSFIEGEDERLARVVISLIRRPDFDRPAYGRWLDAMLLAGKFPEPAAPDALRSQQNARHLLTALWTELSVDDRPSEGADFAKPALREALRKLF
jgi:hypothetical protein